MHFSSMHWIQISTKTYIQVLYLSFVLSQHSTSHRSTCSVFSFPSVCDILKVFFNFLNVFFFPSFLRFFSFFLFLLHLFFLHCPSLQSKLVQVTIPTLVYNPQWKLQSNAFIWKPISFTVRSLENSQETCEDKNNWPLLKYAKDRNAKKMKKQNKYMSLIFGWMMISCSHQYGEYQYAPLARPLKKRKEIKCQGCVTLPSDN